MRSSYEDARWGFIWQRESGHTCTCEQDNDNERPSRIALSMECSCCSTSTLSVYGHKVSRRHYVGLVNVTRTRSTGHTGELALPESKASSLIIPCEVVDWLREACGLPHPASTVSAWSGKSGLVSMPSGAIC